MADRPCADMTWEELAGKIDWEGGAAEFFVGYAGPEEWTDPQLKEMHEKLLAAWEPLEAYLERKGGLY